MRDHPFSEPSVKVVFDAYPQTMRKRLLELRRIIFWAAEKAPAIGDLTETLKWGQPSYLPSKPRIGTTLRLGVDKALPNTAALFFHCQSRLGAEFRETYPGLFRYDGDRAILLPVSDPLPKAELAHCAALALTYHLRKHQASTSAS